MFIFEIGFGMWVGEKLKTAETRRVLMNKQLTSMQSDDDDDETRTMKSGYEKYANHSGIGGEGKKLYELWLGCGCIAGYLGGQMEPRAGLLKHRVSIKRLYDAENVIASLLITLQRLQLDVEGK